MLTRCKIPERSGFPSVSYIPELLCCFDCFSVLRHNDSILSYHRQTRIEYERVRFYCLCSLYRKLKEMATAKQLNDVTECPICTEVYTDPRVLPCGHAFCLKCIQAWSKDKQPGNKVACPHCRNEFAVPRKGVTALPKNFVVANLLQMKKLSPASCDQQHKDETLKIYCYECMSVICTMCYIELHNGHKCADVTKVEDEFRQQMASDTENVAASVEKCREMLQKLQKEKVDFSEQITKVGIEVGKKAEELKQMIDDHKEKLMEELSSMEENRMKEIGSLREEIERQQMSLESYKNYVDDLRQKGTACDVARESIDLHERADKLLMFDVIERKMDDLGHADIMFTSSVGVMGRVSKPLGHLTVLTFTTAKTGNEKCDQL